MSKGEIPVRFRHPGNFGLRSSEVGAVKTAVAKQLNRIPPDPTASILIDVPGTNITAEVKFVGGNPFVSNISQQRNKRR